MRTTTLLVILALVGLASCSDASISQFATIGSPGHIRCYSGGTIIYEGDSTGKIKTEQQSDGWYFKDAKTGKLVRVSGDCLIEN